MHDFNTEKAFIELIRENDRLIYKVCSVYVSDEFPIADLYQEVVYNLWKSFSKFRNECTASTWMYRIALNTCITGMRKELRQKYSHHQEKLGRIERSERGITEDSLTKCQIWEG